MNDETGTLSTLLFPLIMLSVTGAVTVEQPGKVSRVSDTCFLERFRAHRVQPCIPLLVAIVFPIRTWATNPSISRLIASESLKAFWSAKGTYMAPSC